MKIFDSNNKIKWSGKGFSVGKPEITLYKSSNISSNITVNKGKYTVKIFAKNRTGSSPINIKIISEKRILLFNEIVYLNNNWSEQSFEFEIEETYGKANVVISRDESANGSMQIGRFIIEYEQKVNIKQKQIQAVKQEKKQELQIDIKPNTKKILFIVPYSLYGGAEVYLKTLLEGIDISLFSITVLYLKKNPLESLVENKSIIHKIASNNDNAKNYIISGSFDYIIYYNSTNVYKLIIEALDKIKNKPKLIEIYHSDFKWSDSLSSIPSRDNIDIMFSVAPNLGDKIFGVKSRLHLPVPIDITKFNPKDKSKSALIKINNEKKNIGIVARLSKEKNIDLVLDFAKNTDKYNFLIFGEGPEESRLKDRVRIEAINDVYFFGFKLDIWKYYSIFDAFLLTSSMEGTPISILEAMASGIPVFVNPVGNISDIVVDKKTGFYISSDIKKSLNIIDDNIINNDIIQAAKNYVFENHSKNNIVLKFTTALLSMNNLYLKKEDNVLLDGEYV